MYAQWTVVDPTNLVQNVQQVKQALESVRKLTTQIQTATGGNCVSYGYDRVRFLAGVPIGETITVQFEIDDVDQAAQKVISRVEIRTADGTLAVVAQHILKFLEPLEAA